MNDVDVARELLTRDSRPVSSQTWIIPDGVFTLSEADLIMAWQTRNRGRKMLPSLNQAVAAYWRRAR